MILLADYRPLLLVYEFFDKVDRTLLNFPDIKHIELANKKFDLEYLHHIEF